MSIVSPVRPEGIGEHRDFRMFLMLRCLYRLSADFLAREVQVRSDEISVILLRDTPIGVLELALLHLLQATAGVAAA